MLARGGITTERQPQTQRAILTELLGTTPYRGCWLLRLAPGASLWQQAIQAGLLQPLSTVLGSYLAQLCLTLAAWWLIGKSVLVGHFEWGMLLGWGLLLVTTIPFQAWLSLSQSRLVTSVGALFKQRLLAGVLQLEPAEIRHQGAGQFLGRVLAADVVEQLGLASGFVALLALVQLGSAAGVLLMGAAGWIHAVLLLCWMVVTSGVSWLYLHQGRGWIRTYRAITNDLVERMVGHRTRLAQEDRSQWHTTEDASLAHYFQVQTKLDGVESILKAVVPRGWLALGVGGLIYAQRFLEPTTAQLALSVGGILLAAQALNSVVLGTKSIVGAMLAWGEIQTLFQAATREQQVVRKLGSVLLPAADSVTADGSQGPLLVARDLDFRYSIDGRPVLEACTLQVHQQDRFLLEGPSGGGKSTLAGVLAGLHKPTRGLLLLHGTDHQSLTSATWRQRVVYVPQFHENYILTGTLAFNLLLGRTWPAQQNDLTEAETLCRELGLGELIDRMPAGLQQMVGESGWQLSHGERSRLYLARAILQGADFVILDESFGALDPESLELALTTVLAHVPTLLVIAHP
jgi:ATP-binding cassette subfamily B protein